MVFRFVYVYASKFYDHKDRERKKHEKQDKKFQSN